MTEPELPTRYEPLSRLGKGGGGEVWAVRDRQTGERYALKALAEDASEREMAALVREAATLSGLEGLGVPRVVRFGRLPRTGRAYLVRELVEGQSLDELIQDAGDLERALGALASAADQLTVLHRAGLLHGDVKPANIIVEPGGDATLVDLGLAAPWREGGTPAEGLTPRYAAPELFQGRPLTVRAEVFALGIALGEAIEKARSTSSGSEKLAELRAIAERATAPLPQNRYPSVDEFASALRRAIGAALPMNEPESDVALWPVVGIDGVSAELLEAAHALEPGGLLRLSAPPGAGRTALLRRLGWSLGVEDEPVAVLDGEATPVAIASELAAFPSSRGIYVLVDDADALDADALRELETARGDGARLVVVGGARLGTAAREFVPPRLDEHAARDLVRRAIPSLSDALAARVLEVSGGLPGELRRLVRLIAAEPVASESDIERVLGGDAGAAIPSEPLLRAVYYLDRGRYNDAQAALEALDGAAAEALAAQIAFARLELGLGEGAAALERLAPLAACTPADAPERDELVLQLGRAHLGVGHYADVLTCLEPFSAREDALGIEGRAWRGFGLSMLGRHDEARTAIEGAVESARRLGSARLEAVTLVAEGLALQRSDHIDEAREAYLRGIAAAERASDAGMLAVLRGNLAGLLKVHGDIAGAIEQYEAAFDMGRRSGRRQSARQALLNLANLDIYFGRLARARARIDALEQQRTQLAPGNRAQLLGLHAMLFGQQGQLDQAVSHYEACAAAFEALGRGIDAAEARLEGVLAAVRLTHPDVGELRRRLAVAKDELGDAPAHRPIYLLAHAKVALAAGDEREARARLDEALAAARETNQREWCWRALEARAELEEKGGQPLLARRDREEALAVLEEIGARLPRDLREVYWNDPRRAQLRTATSFATSPTEFSAYAPSVGIPRGRGALSGTSSISQVSATPLEQRLARILEVNAELAGEHDLERLTARITDCAVELARAERGFVLLVREDGALTVHASRSRGADAPSAEFSRSIAETVIQTREPIVALNAQSDARVAGYASVHQMMLQSVACVPISNPRGSALGALYVETRLRPGAHFERELPTLRAFADQVAIALENARLITENQRRADELARTNEHLAEAERRLRELLGERTDQLKRARQKLRDARDTLYGHFGYHGLVGTSAAMRRVYALIERVKDTDVPVLITGESGTGKEMVARAIHATSARSKAKMLGVNCGAIPENLLESELFGHVRGAFTGAERERKGLFRECDGGTILLDEIGETPAKMQAGLLRVLQERKVRPVGGSDEQTVDVRVVFATNRDLAAMVRDGKFREDLYYRIHVVEVRLPALRERVEDIPQLVDHFLGLFAARYKREKKSVARESLRLLSEHPFPGNVRELENVLLNAWVMSDEDELLPEDFDLPAARLPPAVASMHAPREPASAPHPAHAAPAPPKVGSKGTTSEHHRNERDRILDALRACNWNRVKAAELSGIPRRTFYRRLREYGIQ